MFPVEQEVATPTLEPLRLPSVIALFILFGLAGGALEAEVGVAVGVVTSHLGPLTSLCRFLVGTSDLTRLQ